MPFGVGLSHTLGQGLIGLLAALIVGLLGTQFGTHLFTASQLFLHRMQGLVEGLGGQLQRGQSLMLLQALLAFCEQDPCLLQRFVTVQQALAKLADGVVIKTQ
ncbi:hypothetical protein D3C77_497630 [compost metagenome]